MAWGKPQTGTGFTPTEDKPDTSGKPARTSNPKKKPRKAAQGLYDALTFIEPATNDLVEYQEYVRLSNRWAVAFDGQLAMGYPIEEELSLCPHLGRLKTAIDKAGATISIAATDNGRLSVAGEKLRAVVPCLPPERYPPVMPDQNIAVLTGAINDGFQHVTALAKDEADRIVEASILLRANTMVGTNGSLILEYWHGIDLPPGLAIPQRAAKAIAKSPKACIGFGFDWGRSATFYFEGGAWLKTQLYDEAWPEIDGILNVECFNYAPLPDGFFDGLAAIEKFSEDKTCHFADDKLRSTYASAMNDSAQELVYGATYDIPGLVGKHAFSTDLLKLAKPAMANVDYVTHDDRAVFYNLDANLRGVLMKKVAA